MSDIYIRLNNEDADITDADLISSGDVDTVNVHFTFSEEWDAFPVKTMCVHAITKEEENRIGTNFIGITSEGLSVVPQGALAKAGRLFIAVVGENPNKQVLTSTWVTLKIRQGADFLVPDDEVDVFGRLMPAGGNEGNILVKNSDENFDYTWKPSSESLEAGLNISIIDKVISSNCFREVEELPETGTAGVIYILDNTESPNVEGVFTWDASSEQYISFGKSYTAGNNITISEQGVISATDTTYTAGNNIQISNENVISATDTTYTAGQNIQINNNNEISATDTTYSAGNGLDLNSENVFKADNIIICDALPQIADAVERDVYALTYIKDAKWLPKTGLPSQYQTEQAYDAWLDDGHTATIFKTSYGVQNAADCILVEDLPPFEIVDDEVYSVDRLADLSGLQMYAITLNIEQTDTVWGDYGTTKTPTVNGLIISAKENNKRLSATQSGGRYVATFDNYYGEYSGIVYSDQLAYQNGNLYYSPSNNQWGLYEPRSNEPHTYVKLYIFDGEKYIYVTDSNLTGHVTSSDINLDEFKRYVEETYALRKYYGNENINLGNNNGVPANTYGSGSIWNEAIGTGNNITGQGNEVAGTNNVVSGNYNNIIGYGLNVNGQFNVAFGPIMPQNKPLTGMCNIVTAYGNDVSGDENAVFGNNNKARGSSHLIAGHGHDVQGYNNLVTGEYSTVNGSDNAVFGINYGTIQGSSNLVNGYYTYVKPLGSGTGSTSQHNIIGGSYITVSGSNNLVVGETTTNSSYTFVGDSDPTAFDHIHGYDNIYSSWLGSIEGNHNLLMAIQSQVYGEQNAIFGAHNNVKGSYNIINGNSSDANFVGSKNIAMVSGGSSTFNNMSMSLIMSDYITLSNINNSNIHAFYSNISNARYITAYGYGLQFNGTLDEYDNPNNPYGLTIIGQWNEDNNDRNDYVFVVGGGSGPDQLRKNVFTITKDGYVTCKVSDSDDKHKILGSACVVTALPQTGQQNTIYVVIEEEGTETTETTDDSITVLGLYIWHEGTQEYYQISTGGGGGGSYVAGNGIRISSNTISVDNIQVVNELPAQGTDNIFYQVPQYEQEFTLDGELPSRFKTQSAYDTWNVGGKAMMLCVDTEATEYASQFGIKYILFEGITLTPIATSSGGQDVYYKITQLGDSPVEYTYSTITNEWTASPITQVSVNDYYVAVGSATGITPRNRAIVISDSLGSINSDIGLEWMSGNDTSNNWSITYQPTQYESHTYTYANDAYEIYTGNPTQISVDVYLYKNGTYSKLTNDGGGGSYTAGNGINIVNNAISVDTTTIQEKLTAGSNITIASNTISADIIEPLVTFSLTPTGTTPAYSIACDTAYSEIVSRYQNKKLKVQMDITYNNGHEVIPMSRFAYFSGTAKLYFEYTDNDKLVVFEISKIGNPSLDTYEYSKTSYDLNLPQAEGGGF